MYLDHRNHVLDVVLEGEGTIDHAAIYPRQILKRVLDLGGTGVILAHNLCVAPHKLCYVE